MDKYTIFTKTAKGLGEALGKTRKLSRDARRILQEIDGQACVQDLSERLDTDQGKLQIALVKLLADDYIREFGTAAPAPVATSQASMGDTEFGLTSPAPLENALSQLTIGDFMRAMETPPIEPHDLDFKSLLQTTPSTAAGADASLAEDEMWRAVEQARKDAELVEQRDRDARAKRIAEEQARAAQEQARREQEAELAARRQAEERERIEREQQAKREAAEKAEKAEKARLEAELAARREQEARAVREAEELAKREQQARLREEAAQQERARLEAERREAERLAEESVRRQAEQAAQLEAEREARLAAEREAERVAQEREQAERRRIEIERQAEQERQHLQAELQARAEAEERARQAAEQEAQRLAEEKLRADAARLAAEERARLAEELLRRQEEEAARRRQEEEQAVQEAARKKQEEQDAARVAAEDAARQAAEEQAKKQAHESARQKAWEAARRAAEELARREAEQQAKKEALERERARIEEEARLAAEAARVEAERRALEEAQERERRLAEEQARAAAEQAAKRAAEEAAREAAEQAARMRAEEDAKRAAEEQARQQARERERREAEERARIAAEEKARAAAEAKAKKEAEQEAKQQAKEAARAAAQEKARIKAEEKARAQAEKEAAKAAKAAAKEAEKAAKLALQAANKAEQEALRAESSPMTLADMLPDPRTARRVLRAGALAVVLLLTLTIGLVHLVSFDGRIAALEQAASEQLRQPVKIKGLYLSFWPAPHWRLEEVAIGREGEVAVARIDAYTALGNLFSDKRVYSSVELVSPILSEAGLSWLMFGQASPRHFDIGRLRATQARLFSEQIRLPAMDVEIELGKDGGWTSMRAAAENGSIRAVLHPHNGQVELRLEAEKLALPFGGDYVLEKFSAAGLAARDHLELRQFAAAAFDGSVQGNARLAWGAGWNLNGELKAAQLSAAQIAPQLLAGGRLGGTMRIAAQADQAGKLLAAPRGRGSFTVADGALQGVNLADAVMGTGRGGNSAFSQLGGDFLLEDGRVQVRRLQLHAGLLAAGGMVDIAAGNLSGRVNVEMKTASRASRAELSLSGTLEQPAYSRP